MVANVFLSRAISDEAAPQGCAWRHLRRLALTVIAALVALAAWPAAAGEGYAPIRSPARDLKTVVVPINKSRIIDLPWSIKRVSVAKDAIADILVVNPKQIYVVGKELGTTNMVLWGDNDQVRDVMGVEVTHDLQSLKKKMHHYLPGERIRIESAQGAIVLSGEVSSPKKMDAALRLAQSFAGDKDTNVMNLLQVGGAQQVLLEVKVAEINRTFLKRMDVRFNGIYNGGSIKIGTVAGGATFPDATFTGIGGEGGGRIPVFNPSGGLVGPVLKEISINDQGITDRGIFSNYLGGNFFFNLIIDAAKDQGLAKILAEPNLTTMSGQEAKFLAGGQFPVPTVSLNGTNVQYKNFGIGLTFVPLVLDSGLISLKVNVSISQLSNENAVVVPTAGSGSFVVPALTLRSANASVEVPSGQTIAIAGLINESLREGSSKFPGLGDLPIIGSLFRSQNYQKGQTELVMFVTPRLARPIRPEMVQLPTDNFVEPNDIEFYLLGHLQGRKPGQGQAVGSTGELGPDKSGAEGFFGHDL